MKIWRVVFGNSYDEINVSESTAEKAMKKATRLRAKSLQDAPTRFEKEITEVRLILEAK